MKKFSQLVWLGPYPNSSAQRLPELPEHWRILHLLGCADLRPWDTHLLVRDPVSVLFCGQTHNPVENLQFLEHLLQRLDWQALCVSEPNLIFAAVFFAQMAEKPACVWLEKPELLDLLSENERQWLIQSETHLWELKNAPEWL